MTAANHIDQIQRNRRKFFMKYGFDLIQYINLEMCGKPEEEIIETLGILPMQLEHFKKDIRINKKVKTKKKKETGHFNFMLGFNIIKIRDINIK